MKVYSGILLARLMAALPWVSSYHALGHRAMGRWGVLLVACTAYAAIYLVPVVLHLVCAQALQQVGASVWQHGTCAAPVWNEEEGAWYLLQVWGAVYVQ